jgi:hypothetical protein
MRTEARPHTIALLGMLLALPACPLAAPVAPAHAPDASAAVPRPASDMPSIELSRVHAAPGAVATVSATLSSAGAAIVGAQNDIVFDPGLVAVAATAAGKPDCTANPQIQKPGTAFSFLPPGCRSGIAESCIGVRALVLSLSDVTPIPNGSVLYSCRLQVASKVTSGTAKLSVRRVGFSGPTGQAIDGVGVDGAIAIGQ